MKRFEDYLEKGFKRYFEYDLDTKVCGIYILMYKLFCEGDIMIILVQGIREVMVETTIVDCDLTLNIAYDGPFKSTQAIISEIFRHMKTKLNII